jgi:hypothetical protein
VAFGQLIELRGRLRAGAHEEVRFQVGVALRADEDPAFVQPARQARAPRREQRLGVPYRSVTVTEPLHSITCTVPAQPVQCATSWWACL